MIQGFSEIGIAGFNAISKCRSQAVNPLGEYYLVMRGFKLQPAKLAGVLSPLVELSGHQSGNKQKQDESHPAFAK